MRAIDTMTPEQLDTLKVKGMLRDGADRRHAKAERAARLAAFADHVFAASEPVHVPGELDWMDEPPTDNHEQGESEAGRNV